MSRDDPELTAQVVSGISDGCIEAECALIGGETAILPEFISRESTIWRGSAWASWSGNRFSTARTSGSVIG